MFSKLIKWRRKSISHEFYYIISILFLVLILFMLSSIYLISNKVFYQHTVSYTNQITDVFSRQMSSTLKQIDNLSFFAYENSTLKKLAHDSLSPTEKIRLSSVLEFQFTTWRTFLNDDITLHQAYFVNQNEVLMAVPWNSISKINFGETDWFQKVKAAKGKPIYYLPGSISCMSDDIMGSPTSLHFITMRWIQNNNGILIMNVSVKNIDSLIRDLKMDYGQQIFLLDEFDQCLFSVNATENPSIFLDHPNVNSNRTIKGKHSDYLCSYFYSSKGRFQYIVLTDYNKLMSPVREVGCLIILLGCIMAILVFFWSKTLIRRTLQGISDLKKNIQTAVDNHFQGEIEIYEENEIRDLKYNFNRMMHEINHLMNCVYVGEIKQKEAKLEALQSQINPHFLYNTLGTIGAMGALNDIPEITDMTDALADLFRYAMNQDNLFVTLQQECDNLLNYIQIQSFRYGSRLSFSFDISNSILSCKVLCFILQPLVENSILHGIDPLPEGGQITVSAFKEKEQLIIQVTDSGIGMDEKKLSELQEHASKPESLVSDSSVGLNNVIKRIYLAYNGQGSISIISAKNSGTTFYIQIPFLE